jgi:hypothetical protein
MAPSATKGNIIYIRMKNTPCDNFPAPSGILKVRDKMLRNDEANRRYLGLSQVRKTNPSHVKCAALNVYHADIRQIALVVSTD